MEWTEQDQAQAKTQGWGLYEVWDERVLYEILRDDNSNIFRTDHDARQWVQARALAAPRDPLAWRAWRLAFDSRLAELHKD